MVVLGGALPGLVAAVVLGQRGARVLVVEEDAAARGFPGLREPFLLPSSDRDSVLGACLRALGIPLIDQRRVQLDPVALQVVLPEARLDVGDPGLTASEWVAWGLAKPKPARELARALAAAADAERRALLAAPLVRSLRRLGLGSLRGIQTRRPPPAPAAETTPVGTRGIPAELAEVEGALAAVLAAQARALARLGTAEPSPEAQARLLGAPLEGGASVRGMPWLREILRQRVLSLYGEFRTLPGPFAIVSAVGQQPGVAQPGSEETWAGRVLILNAPLAALARAAEQPKLTGLQREATHSHRRLALHFRVPRHAVPEAMAPRVLRIADPTAPLEGSNLIALRLFAVGGDSDQVDLVASAVVPCDAPDPAALEREVTAGTAALLPFAELRPRRAAAVRWDSDDWLGDPAAGVGWPAPVDVRASSRLPIYGLDRAATASLGVEGDLLLGWRTADAIIADLS